MAKVRRKECKAKHIRVCSSVLIRGGWNWSKVKLVWWSHNFINGSKNIFWIMWEDVTLKFCMEIKVGKFFAGLSSDRFGTR